MKGGARRFQRDHLHGSFIWRYRRTKGRGYRKYERVLCNMRRLRSKIQHRCTTDFVYGHFFDDFWNEWRAIKRRVFTNTHLGKRGTIVISSEETEWGRPVLGATWSWHRRRGSSSTWSRMSPVSGGSSRRSARSRSVLSYVPWSRSANRRCSYRWRTADEQ